VGTRDQLETAGTKALAGHAEWRGTAATKAQEGTEARAGTRDQLATAGTKALAGHAEWRGTAATKAQEGTEARAGTKDQPEMPDSPHAPATDLCHCPPPWEPRAADVPDYRVRAGMLPQQAVREAGLPDGVALRDGSRWPW
jgi:hypothetical protein